MSNGRKLRIAVYNKRLFFFIVLATLVFGSWIIQLVKIADDKRSRMRSAKSVPYDYEEIFADAISAIHVTGNLVRIDLMAQQPHLKSDNGQPVFDVNQRIIMPLEGFVQSLATQEDIVKQLVEAGVLQKFDSVVEKTTRKENN